MVAVHLQYTKLIMYMYVLYNLCCYNEGSSIFFFYSAYWGPSKFIRCPLAAGGIHFQWYSLSPGVCIQ